jgi:phosphoenolpyruvate synthase/pyruvate phosphate dikinase
MMSYKNSIEQDAKIYGYKSANLIELKEVLEEFEEMISSSKKLFGNLKADVPAFYPIDEKLVRDHLNEYVPEWNDSFKKFQKSYEQQTEKNILSDESKAALSQLQDTITACFEDNPISPDLFQEFLSNNNINENDLLMVRSTGVNEDKANMANPGGNKSIPCSATPREISKALGIVAASYVGEKSLSQRLSSGDKSITDLPVMPGLVQKMIGEGVGGLSNQVFSGVLYTNQGATRIQAAPGHGEYVVNSKGKVDNYYVSASDQRSKNNAIQSRHHESFNDYASNNNSDSEKIPGEYIGIVYSDIAIKDLRLKPLIGNDGKVNLVGIENAANLKYVSSLDEKAVLYLSELSRFVENKYGSRMDIEFVYDAESGHINIVQARAIPEGKRVGLTPSSIAPEFLSQNKSELIVVECLQVITPEVNRAAVVTRDSQMIVTSTIEEALSKYLASNNKEEVQVVIVQNPSPDTALSK